MRESRTKLYAIWQSMRQRCVLPTNESYHRYGGRGISVCSDWNNYSLFKSWALSSGYEVGLVLDRRDNDGNYSPENCRWVSTGLSGSNRSNVKLTPRDVITIRLRLKIGHTCRQIAKDYGINERMISGIKTGVKWAWVDGGTRTTVSESGS